MIGQYNSDGKWFVRPRRLPSMRTTCPRWTLVHLEDDHCIYRAYCVESGEWLSPPLTRRGAINKCREWSWGAIRIQIELGAAILWDERRVKYAISRLKYGKL